jgi:two-component system, response regulator, stage 0 sporulation protein A
LDITITGNTVTMNLQDFITLKEKAEGTEQSIIDTIEDISEHTSQTPSLEQEITNILRSIGVPANIKGYDYIRDALVLSVNDKSYVHSITKALYPTVARDFTTTPGRVERSIRHAIEVAFHRGNTAEILRLFGHTVDASKGKPVNSEFIATIADNIRLKMGDGTV